MRVIVQRVSKAKVDVEGKTVGKIDRGLLLLIGVGENSQESIIKTMAKKIANMRIFEDENGKLNYSAIDLEAEILAVSQFTLYANCKKGRRPDFTKAAKPDKATSFYVELIEELTSLGLKVETGKFGAHMHLDFINDGPVTIILDQDEL